ncbi:sugar phosphorylase [Clostridium chrysemydis]|uniref:sugar phosphorylase n=1 Tax=Clostridium chrysemydis TaxID=2665504 RepID=UPI0018846DDF|nr:sugar phosphorylase [Clostridium chrysemydis]
MDINNLSKKIQKRLKLIYKENYKNEYLNELISLIKSQDKKEFKAQKEISEENVYLITYGDSIYEKGEKTLKTLKKFLNRNVKDTITDVHLLPMFEYTSDDGFSVVDYMKVDEKLGDFSDLKELSKDYRLMYDFVANHMSKESEWFKSFLNDEEGYKDFFIEEDASFDTSNVVRPRTSPLFHKYKGKIKTKSVWTTFSEDQVDLNFKSFKVLYEMTNVLIEYAKNGASSIRLDAIGFLIKESKTSCMHLKETHEIIKLWRDILEYLKKNTQIITETNVPHKENISYFGENEDEANMVYQFALPPLVLYTMTVNDSTKLSSWASNIDKVSDKSTYFNFLSSHDGIGLRPTEGILSNEEREVLIKKTLDNGGKVSYKNNTDGSKSVYELNINYNDALLNKNTDISEDMQVKKIVGAHSILLSFVGVPSFYYHSLLGSRNYYKGVEETGINRRINREKLELSFIENELREDKRRKKIFHELLKFISIRKKESAFSPFAKSKVINISKDVFALERFNEKTNEKILYILNITPNKQTIENLKGKNILNNEDINGEISLDSYEFIWIKIQ